jgi:hypothetical protein
MGVLDVLLILISRWAFNTIARKLKHDKANGHLVGLEPEPPDRHCFAVAINLQRPERSR